MITAWHGNAALKEEVLARLWEHRKADTIIQRLYQQYDPALTTQYRGCAIGCTLPLQGAGNVAVDGPADGWHGRVEDLYGIPCAVGRLIDRIFELLPASEAGDFAVAVMEAIPVGADLSLVPSRLMLDLLADDERGVWRCTAKKTQQRAAIDTVAELYRRRLAGDEPSIEEWKNAADVTDAADAATIHAINTACAAASYGGYGDAAYAAAYAGHAADAAAYADAGIAGHWMADRLIQHLADAPVPVTP